MAADNKTFFGRIYIDKIPREKIMIDPAGRKFFNIRVFVHDEKDKYGFDATITLQKEEKDDRTIYVGNLRKYDTTKAYQGEQSGQQPFIGTQSIQATHFNNVQSSAQKEDEDVLPF